LEPAIPGRATTVRNHLHSVYAKLGVKDKASLAHLLRDSES
jgi:DNA-binding CsgD family transcriptional regulator